VIAPSRVGVACVAIAVLAAMPAWRADGQPRADGSIVCPPGTQRGFAARASGSEEWCERPGTNPRILDGPFVSRHADGAIETRGSIVTASRVDRGNRGIPAAHSPVK
jgi:hypothetical protein